MKSILIGLLLLTSTALCQPSIHKGGGQIASTPDSVYCLSIESARLLIADALRLRVQLHLNDTLSARVRLLESQQITTYNSFSNLLKVEQEKFSTQKENTGHMERLALSYKGQMEYYQKREKKQRKKKNILGGALVVVIVLTLIK